MEHVLITILTCAVGAGAYALHSLKKSVDSYSAEKGKNLAQKEDIAQLTRLVEDVKRQNLVILEDHKFQNQLRLAALDRRLQAHQEAFALWRGIVGLAYGDRIKLGEKVMECQRWWESNCLYLTPKAREAFNLAYMSVSGHKGMVEARMPDGDLRANWATVLAAGQAIVRAVELPFLSMDGEEQTPN